MSLQELIEKRNKLMADAGVLITKATVTAEDRSNFDRMIADADELSADINRLKSVEEFNAQQRSTTRPPRAGFGSEDQTEQTKAAEKRAFGEWFRTGRVSAENRALVKSFNPTSEQRDLAEGSVVSPITGGQVLVPYRFRSGAPSGNEEFRRVGRCCRAASHVVRQPDSGRYRERHGERFGASRCTFGWKHGSSW